MDIRYLNAKCTKFRVYSLSNFLFQLKREVQRLMPFSIPGTLITANALGLEQGLIRRDAPHLHRSLVIATYLHETGNHYGFMRDNNSIVARYTHLGILRGYASKTPSTYSLS